MKKGMLQVQLLVPSVDVDATLTAKMERGEELQLELQSEVKVMDVNSEQKIRLKYGNLIVIYIIEGFTIFLIHSLFI